MVDFGANTQLRHLLPYASRVTLPHTRKACFPLAGCASAGKASTPLDRYERFQLVLTIIPLSCSPDATTLHRCHECLSVLQARIQDVTQRIAEQIRPEHGEADREPGEDHQPWRGAHIFDRGFRQHPAP